MSIDKKAIDPAVESIGDKAHKLTKVALSTIPGLGGAAAELFNALVEAPFERRRKQWMLEITDSLNRLQQEKGVDLGELQNNELFFTTLIQASQIALRNHRQEKIENLRNAVCNSALPGSPDDIYQQIFLNLIDTITTKHIQKLTDISKYDRMTQTNYLESKPTGLMKEVPTKIERYPSMSRDEINKFSLNNQIYTDLSRHGLVNFERWEQLSMNAFYTRYVTDMGHAFLKFINNPFT